MAIFTFVATFTDIGNMNTFMSGLAVGETVTGTMVVEPQQGNPAVLEARLQIIADMQQVRARSVGLDPLAAFGNHIPTGPLASPTVQHGYIDNVFFEVAITGSALGRVGFTVMGTGGSAGQAGHATASIVSITVVQAFD